MHLRTLGSFKLPTKMWVLPRIQSAEATTLLKFEFTAEVLPELTAFESREFYPILNQMQDLLKKPD